MTYRDQQQPIGRDKLRIFRSLWLMSTGGGMVLLGLILFALLQSGSRLLAGLNGLLNTPQPKPQVDVRTVMNQVQSASQLTTAIFAMEAVVPTSQARTLGNLVVGKTTLLYIAYGEVRAGVDLTQMKPENVAVVNGIVHLHLPSPRLLDSKIDVKRSQVYDYNRGFLDLGPDVAPQLQTLAEQQALQKIVAAACTQGVLSQANDRAKLVVSQLMNTAGYKQVVVETQLPSKGGCGGSF